MYKCGLEYGAADPLLSVVVLVLLARDVILLSLVWPVYFCLNMWESDTLAWEKWAVSSRQISVSFHSIGLSSQSSQLYITRNHNQGHIFPDHTLAASSVMTTIDCFKTPVSVAFQPVPRCLADLTYSLELLLWVLSVFRLAESSAMAPPHTPTLESSARVVGSSGWAPPCTPTLG